MIKRIVIAGNREYNNYTQAKEELEACLLEIQNEYDIIVLSGGCRGADLIGERYAREKGYKVEKYPADWQKYGRSAGPKRNEEMAKISDLVICFWDGKSRGTKSMIGYAKKYNTPIKVIQIE